MDIERMRVGLSLTLLYPFTEIRETGENPSLTQYLELGKEE